MKKLKITTIITIAISVTLIILFSVFLVLFLNYNKKNRENYRNQIITISYKEEKIGDYAFSKLVELADYKQFQATYKPNGKIPIERKYQGIEVRELLFALNLDLQDCTQVLFSASDGLQKVYPIGDVLQKDNVFIADMVEGHPFNKGILPNAYSQKQEDGGPFVVIRASDVFSQHRVKLLVNIKVE